MTCLICESDRLLNLEIFDRSIQKTYYQCEQCDFIFLSPDCRLTPQEERKRYELHENDVLELGYQQFVMPLKDEVLKRFKKSAVGLDYGSGKNSAISYLLEKDGYHVRKFDPFFNLDPDALRAETYDYILVCEVAEHFFDPRAEILKLKSLLKLHGQLLMLTSLKTQAIDFNLWSYRRDPTHVCFYTEKTFQWIEKIFDFTLVKIQKPNLVVLQKKG